MEFYDFPLILGIVILSDFHIFSEGLKPPTRLYIAPGLFHCVFAVTLSPDQS